MMDADFLFFPHLEVHCIAAKATMAVTAITADADISPIVAGEMPLPRSKDFDGAEVSSGV
jgi:hypothetical protein